MSESSRPDWKSTNPKSRPQHIEFKMNSAQSSDASEAKARQPAVQDTQHKCGQCGRTFMRSETKCMPFCSVRCQQVDLGRWLDEAYGLPIEGHEDHDYGADENDSY